MGGNALKNTNTRRYELDEYMYIANLVTVKLSSLDSVYTAYPIPHVREKKTFGDLDILYTTWNDVAVRRDSIQRMFAPNEIVKNGDVISFNVEELQVDAIHSLFSSSNYALRYFSWNDAGNLIGRIMHRFGLKHGHKGLVLPLRDSDNHFEDVHLTFNHDDALKFIGLDPSIYNNGFDTFDDLFKYVASSPYYNPEFYKLENLNTIAKTRDRKRSTYNKFLAFGEQYTGPVYTEFKEDKSVYLQKIFDAFPHAYEQFEQANARLATQKFLKQKFNGDLVKELTGLSGKALGVFMKHLREQFEFKDSVLLYLPEATIRKNVLDMFEAFNDNSIL